MMTNGILRVMATPRKALPDVSHLLAEKGYWTAEYAAKMLGKISASAFRSYAARPSTGCPAPVAQVTAGVRLWSADEVKAWDETRRGRGNRRKDV